jgi:GNAT superfamily N-acetyltransferase
MVDLITHWWDRLFIFASKEAVKLLKKGMVRTRLATDNDIDAIVDFQSRMAYESEGLELDQQTLRKGVHAVFLDPQKGKYHLAVEGERIIGSLMITTEWSDWRNQWVLWVQSVYVVPEYRRRGVFRKMYEHLMTLVRDDPEAAGLRLYVDSKNKNAAMVYEALGMDGDHYRMFEWLDN